MTVHRNPLLTALLALSFMLATPAAAIADCTGDKKPHKLKFKVKGGQCVMQVVHESDDTDADTIHVCEGDTVSWKVSGPKKSIVFARKSPFSWADSGYKGGKIEDVVRSGAAKDCQGDECKYSVTVKGETCVFDPKIIVDP